jgi:hypothetical protein
MLGAASSAVGEGSTSDTRAFSARFSMSLMGVAYRRGGHEATARRCLPFFTPRFPDNSARA